MKLINLILLCIFSFVGALSARSLTISTNKLNSTQNFQKMKKYAVNNFKYNIFAIDSHTAGEPTRIIISGLPKIPGKTMIQKKNYFQKNFDFLRKALMEEPRGYRDMFGAIVLPPVSKTTDFGVFFLESAGYLTMCGHGTIGTVTSIIETGLIKLSYPYTKVSLDTPAGIVRATAKMNKKNKKDVEEVTIQNVPSFVFKKDLVINLKKLGKINVDISYGGNFFALVDVDQIKIPLEFKNVESLIEVGMEIRDKVNKTLKVKHPTLDIQGVSLVEIYQHVSKNHYKNIVVFGDGQYDRSPCGTGTSAKLANLYAKGKIKKNQVIINESIIGSKFKGEIVGVSKVGKFPAVIPAITGKAWITGFNQYVVDPTDPFKYGFSKK